MAATNAHSTSERLVYDAAALAKLSVPVLGRGAEGLRFVTLVAHGVLAGSLVAMAVMARPKLPEQFAKRLPTDQGGQA